MRAARSVEVERELVRVEATEDIAAAKAAAERGAYQEEMEIIENRRRAVAQSGAAHTTRKTLTENIIPLACPTYSAPAVLIAGA